MLKEACVENFTNVPKVIAEGANRIELNNDLAAGGTTPSFGVTKKVVEYAHNLNIPVVVMIRPRAGNFVYTKDEIAIMLSDIEMASLAGADGVTFGCIDMNGDLDQENMNKLIQLAHVLDLEIVMHMAFDEIAENQQQNAIDWLSSKKVKRILTHGGSLEQTISDNYPHLKEIINWAKNKIEILPGGGITAQNIAKVARELEVNQMHGTKIVS